MTYPHHHGETEAKDHRPPAPAPLRSCGECDDLWQVSVPPKQVQSAYTTMWIHGPDLGPGALRKAVGGVSVPTHKQGRPLHALFSATVPETQGQCCTVRDMMHKGSHQIMCMGARIHYAAVAQGLQWPCSPESIWGSPRSQRLGES